MIVQTYIMEGPILLGPHPISIALLSQLSTLGPLGIADGIGY